MNFRVGQKIVCIDDGLHPEAPYHTVGKPMLTKGAIYTMAGSAGRLSNYGRVPCILLKEFNWPKGYRVTRFRPVVARSTETGMAMLRPLLNSKPKRELAMQNIQQHGKD
jgi:hypothetical protein